MVSGKSCLEKRNAYPEASQVCTKLSMIPPIIGIDEQNVLKKFIITMYDRSSLLGSICLPGNKGYIYT